MNMTLISQHQCFGGKQNTYSHASTITGTNMRFAVFLPPHAESTRVPALYWLSGLTCTEENFVIKAGAQRVAAALGLAIIVTDTSPRGLALPGENESYDLGVGAGFYVDATETPWSPHYRMYSYVTQELPALIDTHFPIDHSRIGIFGHSMGGHGALIIALKNPDRYHSVSAFAPICTPMHCPWGEKAFTAYLGQNTEKWRDYDATVLIEKNGWTGPNILIDQGSDDVFLQQQLKPDCLRDAAERAGVPLTLRIQAGYDHSYFFIASFIEDHLRFHANNLLRLS